MEAIRKVGANALACNLTNVVNVEVWRDQPDEPAVFQGGEFGKLIIHLWHFHQNNGGGGTLWLRAREDLDNRTVDEFARWGTSMHDLGMLDDGLVLWTSNEPRGDHSVNGPNPLFYLGSLGGKVRTGRYLKVSSPVNFRQTSDIPSVNEVYNTLLRASGLQSDRHGPQKYHRTGAMVPALLLT
jgi:hypothetical protein